MKPFSALMFADSVILFRSVSAVSPQGASRPTYPDPGIPMKASVQSKEMARMDESGRTVMKAVHTVRTTDNPETKADDKFTWAGRTLIAEGPPKPGGIGDVIWITSCQEGN